MVGNEGQELRKALSAISNKFLVPLIGISKIGCCFQIHCRKQRNLNALSNQNFAAILPGDSVAGVVVANGILNFLNIYNTLLIVRLVLTWFPNSPPAIVSPLRSVSKTPTIWFSFPCVPQPLFHWWRRKSLMSSPFHTMYMVQKTYLNL